MNEISFLPVLNPLTIFLISVLLFWIYFYGSLCIVFLKIRILDNFEINYKDYIFPKISIVVTACNEEKTLEPALRSLMNQNYPDFEVIAVNDRSTDQTPIILNRLAGEFGNLRIVHIESLPEKWLGKVHALHTAAAQTSGEWILFTDADVHFSLNALKKSLFYADTRSLDHYAVAPKMAADSFLLKIMFLTFSYMFMFISTGIPGFLRRDMAVGIGAFNLVRKSAFEKTEGFEWLRMEVADDVGLALLLKRNGAKSEFALAVNDVIVKWYHSFSEMKRGLEKNIFGVSTGYKLSKSILHLFLVVILTPAPLIAIFLSPYHLIQAAGMLTLMLLVFSGWIHKYRFQESFLPSLFIPFGLVALSFISLRAGIICMRNGGIRWRGTFYSIADLKNGQRVRTDV